MLKALKSNQLVTDRPMKACKGQILGITTELSSMAMLESIWEDILETPLNGEGNFFALGGHSLLAVELIARIEEKWGVEITMKDIIEYPEISELARLIDQKEKLNPKIPESFFPHDSFPLTPNQRHIWNLVALFPQDNTHNISNAIRIRKKLDLVRINKILNQLFLTHDALRITFVKKDQDVFQKVKPFEYREIKFTPLKESDIIPVLSQEMNYIFQLEQDDLVRVHFYQLNDDDYIFFFMAHHIVWDGISNIVFFNTFLDAYESLEEGPVLSDKKIGSYQEYVEQQEAYFKSQDYLEELHFWKNRFEQVDEIPFIDRDFDGNIHDHQSHVLNLKIEGELLQKAENYVRSRHISLYHFFFSCFHFLLYQLNGSKTQVIGTPVHGRSNRKFRKTLGYFINTLPFIHHLAEDRSLRENLNMIIQNLAENFYHQEVPFEHILKKTKAKQLLSHQALFQTLFVYLDVTNEMKVFERDEFDLVKIDRKSSHTEMDFYVYKAEKDIDVVIEYRKSFFEKKTMEEFFTKYLKIVELLLESEETKLSELSNPHNSKEKHYIRLIDSQLGPKTEIPSFLKIISNNIQKYPNQLAVEGKDFSYTYGKLGERIKQISSSLHRHDISSHDIVGVYLDRDESLIPTILAILKVGATYLPLDPSFPEERLRYMIKKCGCKLIVTHAISQKKFSHLPVLTIESTFTGEVDWQEDLVILPTDSAYILFTSGSTGNPKGVEVTHENVSNFLLSMKSAPGMDSHDKLLSVTTISFDISVLEMFLPLYAGARLYLASKEEVTSPRALKDILNQKDITIMQATPVTWRMLMNFDQTAYPALKVLCGGEALDQKLAQTLLLRVKEVWNMYGPTETTVWSSTKKISPVDGIISVGRPILNTEFFIMDEELKHLPVKEKGRLYIGGKGVSKGYLGEMVKTIERFISHPERPQEIIYDTGDIAYYNEQGEVICLGRADNQVKIRGYRIELGEIEEVSLTLPSVFEAAAKVIDQDIYLFVSLKSESDIELKNYLARKLPSYMLPRKIICLTQLPKTPNGKIDKNKLHLTSSPKASKNLETHLDDEVSEIILRIWEKHLNLSGIDIEESFFNLGGHSLIALDIFHQINNYFNINLELAEIFEHHSVTKLSLLVQHKINSKNEFIKDLRYIVKINENDENQKNLFCFHGVGGNVLNYYPLAQVLKDFNFYGVQSSGLNGKDKIFQTLPQMAQAYIREMKMIQPHGPYLLAGGSMGGMIAVEVASQLAKENEVVEHVFMFDTFGPDMRFEEALSKNTLEKLRDKFKFYQFLWEIKSYQKKGQAISYEHRYQFIEYKHLEALRCYKPSFCHFPVTLIRALRAAEGIYQDPYLGWENYMKGEFRIIEIPGEHDSFIETQDFLQALKQAAKNYQE